MITMTIKHKIDKEENELIMSIPEDLAIEGWIHYFATILFWFRYSPEGFEEVFGKDWDNI